jgi:hypothetical protein
MRAVVWYNVRAQHLSNVACGQNTTNSVPCVSQHVLLQLGPLCSLNLTNTDRLFPHNCSRKSAGEEKVQTISCIVQENNLRYVTESCDVPCTYSRCCKQRRMKTRKDVITSAATQDRVLSWKTIF